MKLFFAICMLYSPLIFCAAMSELRKTLAPSIQQCKNVIAIYEKKLKCINYKMPSYNEKEHHFILETLLEHYRFLAQKAQSQEARLSEQLKKITPQISADNSADAKQLLEQAQRFEAECKYFCAMKDQYLERVYQLSDEIKSLEIQNDKKGAERTIESPPAQIHSNEKDDDDLMKVRSELERILCKPK